MTVTAQGADLNGALDIPPGLFELVPLVVDLRQLSIQGCADRVERTRAFHALDPLRGNLVSVAKAAVEQSNLAQSAGAEQLGGDIPAVLPYAMSIWYASTAWG